MDIIDFFSPQNKVDKSEELITTKFYCVQPVHIKTKSFIKLLKSKADISQIRKASANPKSKPIWVEKINQLYDLYTFTAFLDVGNSLNPQEIQKELTSSNWQINGELDISPYLNHKETKVYLLFDYRLVQFVILYEIAFSFPLAISHDILTPQKGTLDFYNLIRNIYVKEDNQSSVLPHIQTAENNLIQSLKSHIKSFFSVVIPEQDLQIHYNSGNITNIVILDNIDDKSSISKLLIDLNTFAERLDYNKKPTIISENSDSDDEYSQELYYFNGRFHTIILHERSDQFRYIPIQFHVQLLWFYLLKQINLVLEKYHEHILSNNSVIQKIGYIEEIDLIINKVEILNVYNQKFRFAIESDNSLYDEIESRWNIENMMKGANEYISFFKDYLSRLYAKKTAKVEQRQNRILLFITIFQFIALISVWNDYLSLLDSDNERKASKILSLFGGYDNLERFNLNLPLLFLALIGFMMIYIFRTKK